MTALSLLRHAIGLLIGQPLKTLTVIGPALVLMIGLSVMISMTGPDLLTTPDEGTSDAILPNWLGLVALAFSYSLMAILWHRHTLSSLHALAPFSAPLVLSYLWRVVLLTTVQITVGLVLTIPLILSSQNGDAGNAGPALLSIILTTFVTQLILVWLSLRLSLILPAAAIGHPIRMTESWQYTLTLARPLWGIAALLAVFNTALMEVVSRFDLTKPHHTLIIELPVYIFEGLLIFSILTTLYARQVHGETLNPALV